MDNKRKLALAKEAQRRKKIAEYEENFEVFSKEQIKILTKDSSKGFVPFEFNDAQKIVNKKIEEQLKETGRVRAIILKGRQMGLSTFTTARVFWKSYFNAYNKSVVMAHDSATSDSLFTTCLLYTFDAADELLCVNFGGRRTTKQKTNNNQL